MRSVDYFDVVAWSVDATGDRDESVLAAADCHWVVVCISDYVDYLGLVFDYFYEFSDGVGVFAHSVGSVSCDWVAAAAGVGCAVECCSCCSSEAGVCAYAAVFEVMFGACVPVDVGSAVRMLCGHVVIDSDGVRHVSVVLDDLVANEVAVVDVEDWYMPRAWVDDVCGGSVPILVIENVGGSIAVAAGNCDLCCSCCACDVSARVPDRR